MGNYRFYFAAGEVSQVACGESVLGGYSPRTLETDVDPRHPGAYASYFISPTGMLKGAGRNFDDELGLGYSK